MQIATGALEHDVWTNLQREWSQAIATELKHGNAQLIAIYDEAYIAQLEAERGPISVEDYSRVVVAAERGPEAETLAELDLPRTAVARLRRVWLRKTLGDKALARQVREAIERA